MWHGYETVYLVFPYNLPINMSDASIVILARGATKSQPSGVSLRKLCVHKIWISYGVSECLFTVYEKGSNSFSRSVFIIESRLLQTWTKSLNKMDALLYCHLRH